MNNRADIVCPQCLFEGRQEPAEYVSRYIESNNPQMYLTYQYQCRHGHLTTRKTKERYGVE